MKRLSIILAVIVIAAVSAPLSGQSIWSDPTQDQRSIGLEVIKPNFDGEPEHTLTTSVFFLTLKSPLTNALSLHLEAPFAHGAYRDHDGFSRNSMGNPYLGIDLHGEDTPLAVELGVRLPVAKSDNLGAQVGTFSNYDRLEAFVADELSVRVMGNYRYDNKSGLMFHLRGGTIFLVNTDKQMFEEASDVNYGYSAQLGYDTKAFSLIGMFCGRVLTEEDFNFGERSFHELGFAAKVGLGSLRPGASFRVPLDSDSRSILDFVAALTLEFQK